MYKHTKWLLIALLLSTVGCANNDISEVNLAPIKLNNSLFLLDFSVESEQELYQLSEQQKNSFQEFYQAQINKGYLPHEIVSKYLASHLSNFTYFGKTYTAQRSMSENNGNCMSLAILTTAFSRLVNVEIGYRETHSLPIYEKHGNILLSSSHVQSLLYDPSFTPEIGYIYASRPAIIIDYFPQEGNLLSKKLDSKKFLAMYYVNKAAELYIENILDKAIHYAREAYRIDSESVSAMNLLALIHNRKGDIKTAENLYLAALSSSDINISILDNYVNILKSQGKSRQVNELKRRLNNIYDPNPYHWLEKAQLARYKDQYSDAIRFYKKAIKLAPYIKQAYIELHEVYLQEGKTQHAISTLKESLIWHHDLKQKRKLKKRLFQLDQAI